MLAGPLASIFRDKTRPDSERDLATSILADYSSQDPGLLADLLMDASPKAYAVLLPIAAQQESTTSPRLLAELSRKTTYSWNDPPVNSSWTEPDRAPDCPDRSRAGNARRAIRLLPVHARG